jgi:predicted nucleic-acid-binding Zn-ribbon protein
MGKREWKRTCKRCGETWFAPIEIKPNRLEIHGSKTSAAGKRMSLFGGGKAAAFQLRANSLEAKRDRIEGLERCPKCGSGSYSHERVRV